MFINRGSIKFLSCYMDTDDNSTHINKVRKGCLLGHVLTTDLKVNF